MKYLMQLMICLLYTSESVSEDKDGVITVTLTNNSLESSEDVDIILTNEGDKYSVSAVSYTHLDVYKRQADRVHIVGTNGNRTDLYVKIHELKEPSKETAFENCVADVNIPVGEVFTSPVLEGTNGKLHVSQVYLNELNFLNLEIDFKRCV